MSYGQISTDNHSSMLSSLLASAAVEDENLPYKKAAAHVLAQAISDISSKDRRTRTDARRFLFATDKHAAAIRSFWLALLNHDDNSFYSLLRRRTFQGLPNKLGNLRMLVDNAAASYFNSLPALEHDDSEALFEPEHVDQPLAA